MTVSSGTLQAAIWANKVAKGFNTADVPLEICLLQAEVTEFFDAWRHGETEALAPEIADIAIFTYGLAQMVGVDLDAAVRSKTAKNARRRYRATAHGHAETTDGWCTVCLDEAASTRSIEALYARVETLRTGHTPEDESWDGGHEAAVLEVLALITAAATPAEAWPNPGQPDAHKLPLEQTKKKKKPDLGPLKPRPFFQCKCGHPGSGCTCRSGY